MVGEIERLYWRSWPPPQGWYQDNSGYALSDIFLYEKDKKKQSKSPHDFFI